MMRVSLHRVVCLLVCHLNLLTMKFLLELLTLVHLFLLLQVHLKVLPGYCLFRVMDRMSLKVSPMRTASGRAVKPPRDKEFIYY